MSVFVASKSRIMAKAVKSPSLSLCSQFVFLLSNFASSATARFKHRYPLSRLGNTGYERGTNAMFGGETLVLCLTTSNKTGRMTSKDRHKPTAVLESIGMIGDGAQFLRRRVPIIKRRYGVTSQPPMTFRTEAPSLGKRPLLYLHGANAQKSVMHSCAQFRERRIFVLQEPPQIYDSLSDDTNCEMLKVSRVIPTPRGSRISIRAHSSTPSSRIYCQLRISSAAALGAGTFRS